MVVGYAEKDACGTFVTLLDPHSTFRFPPGVANILLGSAQNLPRLQQWIGIQVGG
ncbi:MAG: hypothetical protein L3K10_02685 [Thermoplasmata archaeon]|nr:hypothetical protein [Thermoplasmata archaeon]